MKKKFIFLAMLLLTVLGGVKFNVLNAQENVVTINGDATSSSALYPIGYNNSYSLNQHVYAATSIDHDEGVINAIAFKRASTTAANRNIKVYLKNTDVTSLSSYESFSQEDQVFYSESFNTAPSEDGWLTISLGNNFTYEGGNILLVVIDNTGSMVSGDNGCCYATKTSGSTFYGSGYSEYSETNFPNGWSSNRQPAIKFFFAEPEDDIIPAAPTNLVATTIDHKSVSLTWEAGENAKKYNVHVYNNGAEIAGSPYTTDETAYTVEGLEAETTYTFKVQSVRGSNLSEDFSNEASATTSEAEIVTIMPNKLYRIKALSYNTKDSNNNYDGPFSFSDDMYLHITSYSGSDEALVWVLPYEETSAQMFTFESTGTEDVYYLRSADGYYIRGYQWNVSSTLYLYYASQIRLNFIDGVEFYLMNGNKYYKAEYGDGGNCKVYCDFDQQYQYMTATWVLEEVPLFATAYASKEMIYDDETITLGVNVMSGSDNYTYSWSPIEGLDDATSANPAFTPFALGEYTFTCTVTDTESNTTTEASVKVYVYERPNLELTVSADKNLIYNDGETAVLTATVTDGYAPYTYSWTLDGEEVGTEATYSFSNTTVGEYTLTCTVTDARGNTQTASTTIEVKDVCEKPLEIVIGSNGGGQNNIPLNSYYYAAFSQQIYTSDQIGKSGCIINDISFYRTEDIGLNDRNIEIYLLNTDKSKFDNVNDWVKLSENDKVYANNSYTSNGLGWFTFTLDTPFEYTGGNLLVCMHVIRKGYNYTNYDKYAVFATDDARSLYKAGDNDSYNIGGITQVGTLLYQLNHIKLGYELPAPKPENLVIVEGEKTQLYPGETTKISWDALDGATSYNVYVNDIKFNEDAVEGLSYELVNLPYGMNEITVTAVFEDGSESGKSNIVTVQVAGTFTLTVNVTDGTNPIEGATVNIDMAYAYDEFKNQISTVTVEPTGADGKTTIELLRLPNEGFYNDNGNWVYPFYTVEVSKSPYQKQEKYINPGDVVTNGYTMDFELALPMVNDVQVKDEEGNYLYGDVMEGTNVVLSWDELEGATAYNVYKLLADEVESSETIEETTYTIQGVEKGYQYAVSALFGELESEKAYANLQVKGNGYFKGYVTDGTNNALQGIQVKVSSEYGDASVVVTTDEVGYFEGEIMEGNNYTLTISHSDYEEFGSESFEITYGAEYDFGTIVLTAKPSAAGITEVTATVNGENVDVDWTVDEAYTKYNVYRRLAGTQGKGDNIAQELATNSYTDTDWSILEPGTYQYGVSALVEPQAQTRGTEVIFEEGFEGNFLPENWNQSGDTPWTKSQTRHSGLYSAYNKYNNLEKYSYLVTPMINTEGAKLSFWYMNKEDYGYTSDLIVYYSTESSGTWTNILFQSSGTTTTWLYSGEIDLSSYPENIYIAFCHKDNWGGGVYIDDVIITREKVDLVETQIVWSDGVVKQGPNTFEGTVSTDWNVPGNWSHGNVPATGDEVIVNAEAVISGNVELSTLDIIGNGSVTVNANASLTVSGKITQEKAYSLIMNDGAQVFQNNANVTAQFNMNLVNPTNWSSSNKDGWQFISSPLSNVSVINIAEGNYDLYKYDGDAESELEWLNHKDENFADATYQHHIGYLASHETMSTLEFKGTLNYNDYNGSYAFYDYVEYYKNEPLKNFYLIGNPYPFNISWADFKNNKGMVNGYAYVKEDGNYEYATSGEIAVGDGFFVQAISGTPDDQYSTYYYYLKGSGNTRSTKESNNSLNITATGNAGKDNVVINFAGKSEGFNKLQNFNDAIATVYVSEDGKNYGIYNCDADVQEVELSFAAATMGNYTIAAQPNGEFETVVLVDRATGVETNLLVEDYTFTATSNDNHNRFVVKFVNGQQSTVNSHFVYQSGEELILNIQGEVQIVDVLGRVVYNGEAKNDINRINVGEFSNGTYMVRVVNEEGVKVEKIIL